MALANRGSADVVLALCDAIHEGKERLSEIDGATGDGDHGVNMNKGFALARSRINPSMSLVDALEVLGDTLVDDIGGSMGPIYGTFFLAIATTLDGRDLIDEGTLAVALAKANKSVMDLTGARPKNKTLIDVLSAACEELDAACAVGESFAECLARMDEGAKRGLESTKGMQARVGRAARLGRRSIGHVDAGAASCYMILHALAQAISLRL